MTSWLGRAVSAFGQKTAPAPQPFDIACECGEQVTGWRTETHQKVNCTACDRPLLVLPGNIYPAVKRKQTPAATAKPAARSRAVVDDEATDEAQVSQVKPRGKSKSRSGSSEKNKPGDAARSKAEDVSTTPEGAIELPTQVRQSRSRRRVIGLITVTIVALLGLTGWSLSHRAQQEQARATIPAAVEAGVAALRAGDFAAAVRELAVALKGIETLRRTDAAAESIRQAYREAVAAQGLSAEEFSQLAAKMTTGFGTVEDRQRHFQTEHGADWLVFDVGLVSRNRDGQIFYELDVPLMAGDQPLQLECDLPQVRDLVPEAEAAQPVRIILAGQIESWLVPETPTRPLVARIRKSNLVLWHDYESYLAVGYRPESPEAETQTRAQLEKQRELGGKR